MLTLWEFRVRDDAHPNGYREVNVLAYTPSEAGEKLRKVYPNTFYILSHWYTVDIE